MLPGFGTGLANPVSGRKQPRCFNVPDTDFAPPARAKQCIMVSNQGLTMKTFLLFLSALAFILAGAHLTSGQLPGGPLVLAGAVVACIITWTIRQYERTYPPLSSR